MQEQFLNRFLNYVQVNTRSDSASETVPSTPGQLSMARILKEELETMGLEAISLDDNGYLMARLPANTDKSVPAIGFVAHMDTAPDASGEGVSPQVIDSYDGSEIVLNADKNILLSPSDFPSLKKYVGKTLVTSDGTTLLGADDKAGIAIILTAIEYLQQHPDILHGDICIGFTPDEEIGRGADHFDVEKFGAQWAYTIDGGEEGGLEYENFNAASAEIICHGRNVHPGTAKGLMINAMHLARHFANELPANEVPEKTEGYEGFFHLHSMTGHEDEARLSYIIRDFDHDSFEQRKQLVLSIAESMNKQLGEERIKVVLTDSYANMHEEVKKVPHIIDIAHQAMEACDVKPLVKPIRGGTDGARLSFMGLPTPNIFTGGHNFHGCHEYLCVDTALKSIETVVNICRITAER